MDIPNGVQLTSSISPWLWVFPATYMVHAAEEYWGGEGYSAYLFRLRGVHISKKRFVFFHALGLSMIVIGVVLSNLLQFQKSLMVILGALVLCNGVSHTVTAIWARGYGPGLVTSILWIPLGAISLFVMYGQMPNLRLVADVFIGFGINGAVALFTLRGASLSRSAPDPGVP